MREGGRHGPQLCGCVELERERFDAMVVGQLAGAAMGDPFGGDPRLGPPLNRAGPASALPPAAD